jgi:prophage regulatory protein
VPRLSSRPPDPAARYWRLPQVTAYTGRSRSRIYEDPTFPRPIRLGPNTAAWIVTEVIAWCEACEAESRRQNAA